MPVVCTLQQWQGFLAVSAQFCVYLIACRAPMMCKSKHHTNLPLLGTCAAPDTLLARRLTWNSAVATDQAIVTVLETIQIPFV